MAERGWEGSLEVGTNGRDRLTDEQSVLIWRRERGGEGGRGSVN